MESNGINLGNDLKVTYLAGGKLLKEVHWKVQITGQPSILVCRKGNLVTTSVIIIHHISCQTSHSRMYQLQSKLYVCNTNSNNINRPISYSMCTVCSNGQVGLQPDTT